jgi:hypothetical protein
MRRKLESRNEELLALLQYKKPQMNLVAANVICFRPEK